MERRRRRAWGRDVSGPAPSSLLPEDVPVRANGSVPRNCEPSVRFDAVTKRFEDGTEALRAVSFSVPPGQFVALVGPSGCGKSTVLRLASGLAAPTKGQIDVHASPVGYVFQDATLLPWRTVLKNVELLGQLHGVPKEARRQNAVAAIRTVGLAGFEAKYPRALSGGMKMRASLARPSPSRPRSSFSTSRSVLSMRSLVNGSMTSYCSCSRTGISPPFSSPTR